MVTTTSRAVRALFMAACCMTLLLTTTAPAQAQIDLNDHSQCAIGTDGKKVCGNNSAGHSAYYTPQRTYVQQQPRNSEMPGNVQRLIGAAQKMECVGTLPNGDKIYLVSGLRSLQPDTTPEQVTPDITVINLGYCTGEALLMYSKHFERWDVLTFNPSMAVATDSNYVITGAQMQPDWHIAVTFTNAKKQTIRATYRLDLERFVYKSTSDQVKIEGRIPGSDMYFGSLE